MVQVSVHEETFARLQQRARPLLDTAEDVIRRALDETEKLEGKTSLEPLTVGKRSPRQRGIEVEFAGHIIRAISVGDLFAKTLKILSEVGKLGQLVAMLPISTSSQRYLAASKPLHPSGRAFVNPIIHKSVAMEAHKSYKRAVKDLGKLLKSLGFELHVVKSLE